MDIKLRIKNILPDAVLDIHNENYACRQDKELRTLLDKNIKWRNKYKGERCFIIGNGPSINKMNLALLKNEYTFTVNQFSRSKGFEELNTTFHVWQDMRFFDFEDNESATELINVMNGVSTGKNKPVVFFRSEVRNMVERYGINSDLDKYYFMLRKPKKYNPKKFNDYTRVVYDFPTVIHTCVSLAVYMGFKQIYLLGCDCTGIITIVQTKLKNAEQSSYAYDVTDSEKKRMERIANITTFRDEMASQVELLDLYQYLKIYCEINGATLYNATEGGLLECLPRVDIKKVIENGAKNK